MIKLKKLNGHLKILMAMNIVGSMIALNNIVYIEKKRFVTMIIPLAIGDFGIILFKITLLARQPTSRPPTSRASIWPAPPSYI